MARTCTDLDLLLIGKTGNGKSRTGNSILKRKIFQSKASFHSVTKSVQSEVSEYKGRIIKVVDGPGVRDTELDNAKGVELVTKAMNDAILRNPGGYHAFLLVIRFGGRFTREDIDTVELLKKIFGEDFVKNFCILIMTCGDGFKEHAKESGETFQQWCLGQKGIFKKLLDECAGRIVLFNNTTEIEAEKNAQLDRLIQMVHSLASQGHRYTDEHFEKAKEVRHKAIVESREPVIREETEQESSLILQAFEKTSKEKDPQKYLDSLQSLLERATRLLTSIQEQDQGTGALHRIEENAQSVQRTITEAINTHNKLMEEKEKMKLEEEKKKAEMEKQMQEEKERLEKEMEKKSLEEKQRMKREWEERERKFREEEEKRKAEREKEYEKKQEEERKELQAKIEKLDAERRRIQEESGDFWNNFGKFLGHVFEGVTIQLRF